MGVEILTSLHGRRVGLDVNGDLVVNGQRVTSVAAGIAAGSTLTLDAQTHAGKEILLNALAGSVVTLPAATGSRDKYFFRVSVLATSAAHIVKVGNTTDAMQGIVLGTRVDSGNAVLGFAAASTSDTITLNRTTTGSVSLGEWLELEDVAAGFWHVKGVLTATGAAFATPFSATVDP